MILTPFSSPAVPPQFVSVKVGSDGAPFLSSSIRGTTIVSAPAIRERNTAETSCSSISTFSFGRKKDNEIFCSDRALTIFVYFRTEEQGASLCDFYFPSALERSGSETFQSNNEAVRSLCLVVAGL